MKGKIGKEGKEKAKERDPVHHPGLHGRSTNAPFIIWPHSPGHQIPSKVMNHLGHLRHITDHCLVFLIVEIYCLLQTLGPFRLDLVAL